MAEVEPGSTCTGTTQKLETVEEINVDVPPERRNRLSSMIFWKCSVYHANSECLRFRSRLESVPLHKV